MFIWTKFGVWNRRFYVFVNFLWPGFGLRSWRCISAYILEFSCFGWDPWNLEHVLGVSSKSSEPLVSPKHRANQPYVQRTRNYLKFQGLITYILKILSEMSRTYPSFRWLTRGLRGFTRGSVNLREVPRTGLIRVNVKTYIQAHSYKFHNNTCIKGCIKSHTNPCPFVSSLSKKVLICKYKILGKYLGIKQR